MVNGSPSSPPPPAQAWASNSRLTRSSWRTWPHRKPRTNVPSVYGALTVHPSACSVPPARIGSAASMHSPPASGFAQAKAAVHQFTQTQMVGQGDRKNQARIGHQVVIVERDVDAVGTLRWYEIACAGGAGRITQSVMGESVRRNSP